MDREDLFYFIETGNIDICENLATICPGILFKKNHKGEFPFDVAAETNSAILDVLIHAVDFPTMVNKLKDNEKDFKYLIYKFPILLSIKDKKRNTSLLHMTILWPLKNNNAFCKIILEHPHVNVEITDSLGTTPLFYAISTGNVELVEYLVVEKKANVNHKCILDTPLHNVFHFRPKYTLFEDVHEKMCKILLHAGAEIDSDILQRKDIITPKALFLIEDTLLKRTSNELREIVVM